MQTTVRSTIHLLEWPALWRGCGELELSHTAGGEVKWLSHFGKQLRSFLQSHTYCVIQPFHSSQSWAVLSGPMFLASHQEHGKVR